MIRMLPAGFLAVLIVLVLSAIAVASGGVELWEHIHDKLRQERKEDEREQQ